MTNKVIQGTYADFKIVKTRGVAQFVVEVPIEQAQTAISMFGVPTPHEEQWVAIAALNRTAAPPSHKEQSDAVKSASMLCQSINFAHFIRKFYDPNLANHPAASEVATSLCSILGISSRSELHTNETALLAFNRLKGEYHAWVMDEQEIF